MNDREPPSTGDQSTSPPGSVGGLIERSAVWTDLPRRTILWARGGDAVRFLDGFTTAAVARIPVGGGSEGFITDARGWVLALADLLRVEGGVRIEAGGGLGARLIDHLEHYHIREDISFVDGSDAWMTFVIAGPRAPAWMTSHAGMAPPRSHLDHGVAMLDGMPATCVRTDWYGVPAYRLQVEREAADRVAAWFTATGLPRAPAEEFEAARIEAGSPEPRDIPEKTLPQELGRDERAISFTKGCYLGQETVARIDALGHVNRRLVSLACVAAEPGLPVTLGADVIGTVTSACHALRHAGTVALAMVHTRGLAANAGLSIAGAPATVVPFRVVEREPQP